METAVQAKPTPTTPKRARKVILLTTAPQNDKDVNFEEIMALDDINYVQQALEIGDVFQGALNSQLQFDVALAQQGIKNFNTANPDKKIVVMQTLNTTKTQTNSAVSAMVNQIVQVLKDVVKVALNPTSISQITATITDAFTNLATQQGDAWIFWEKKTANKTTYSYQILFAVQNAETGLVMLALATALDIVVDKEFEKVLFITVTDKETYSVNIKAMKVAQALVGPSETLAAQAPTAARLQNITSETLRDVRVTNLLGEEVATAPEAEYTKNGAGSLQQVMTSSATITKELVEGHDYTVNSSNHAPIGLSLKFMEGEFLWLASAEQA